MTNEIVNSSNEMLFLHEITFIDKTWDTMFIAWSTFEVLAYFHNWKMYGLRKKKFLLKTIWSLVEKTGKDIKTIPPEKLLACERSVTGTFHDERESE